jgi:hypothetical protein
MRAAPPTQNYRCPDAIAPQLDVKRGKPLTDGIGVVCAAKWL